MRKGKDYDWRGGGLLNVFDGVRSNCLCIKEVERRLKLINALSRCILQDVKELIFNSYRSVCDKLPDVLSYPVAIPPPSARV